MQSRLEIKLASMNLKSLGLKSNMLSFPSARTCNTSANPKCQPLAFDSSSSFLSPDTANLVRDPYNAATTLAQQRAKPKDASNPAHRISASALAAGECGTWAGASELSARSRNGTSPSYKRYPSSPGPRPQSTDFSGLTTTSAFCAPRPDSGAASSGLDNLPRHRLQLGEYGKHPAPAHVPEVVDN